MLISPVGIRTVLHVRRAEGHAIVGEVGTRSGGFSCIIRIRNAEAADEVAIRVITGRSVVESILTLPLLEVDRGPEMLPPLVNPE